MILKSFYHWVNFATRAIHDRDSFAARAYLITSILVECYNIYANLLESTIVLSIEQLMKEALSLPNALRAQLAERLVESLEFDIDGTVQKLWTAEAKLRRDEIRSGKVEPISGEEALAQIRRIVSQ